VERLFTLIVINCAVRNGDAHLKNFGIVYDDVSGEASLAPVYDLVTTTVYMPNDSMALTLNGSTRWPSSRELRKFGETRALCSPAAVKQIFERTADAISSVGTELRSYIRQHPEFREPGKSMLGEWEKGRKLSLQAD